MTGRNWGGNVEYGARRVLRPRSVDELRGMVANADRIRALGTGHSFSRVADTRGDLIGLQDLPPRLEIGRRHGDGQRRDAVRRAGRAAARSAGRALHNLGSLPHISVGGACATGTHGSGDGNPCLAAAVTEFELVTAGGELVTLRTSTAVGLGRLGVVTALTLRTQPTYDIQQVVYDDLPLDALDDLDGVFGAGYSVSLFTRFRRPVFDQAWRQAPGRPGRAVDAAGTWLGAARAPEQRHPVPGEPAEHTHAAGRSARALAHPAAALPAGVHAEQGRGDPVRVLRRPRARCRRRSARCMALGARLAPVLLDLRDPYGRRRRPAGEHGLPARQRRAALHLDPRPGRGRGSGGRGRGRDRAVRAEAALGQGLHDDPAARSHSCAGSRPNSTRTASSPMTSRTSTCSIGNSCAEMRKAPSPRRWTHSTEWESGLSISDVRGRRDRAGVRVDAVRAARQAARARLRLARRDAERRRGHARPGHVRAGQRGRRVVPAARPARRRGERALLRPARPRRRRAPVRRPARHRRRRGRLRVAAAGLAGARRRGRSTSPPRPGRRASGAAGTSAPGCAR